MQVKCLLLHRNRSLTSFGITSSTMKAARRKEVWTRFTQWIAEQQFGHLAMITLAMEDHPAPEPTEADYLEYFAHLWETRRHSLSSTYRLLKISHQMIYGRDLEQWPNIRQSLQQYENEEQQPKAAFHYNGVAFYWIGH